MTTISAYVDPNTPATAEWVEASIQYVVPEGSPLIGQEFTWGFDWTKASNGAGFFAFFDEATVNFVAIPEPSTALLGGIGLLLLLRRRR